MAHIRSLRGGRAWFGKLEAKAAGRRSRRQVDAEEILAEVAQCGAEDIDERIWYMEVQVDKGLWRRLQAWASDA